MNVWGMRIQSCMGVISLWNVYVECDILISYDSRCDILTVYLAKCDILPWKNHRCDILAARRTKLLHSWATKSEPGQNDMCGNRPDYTSV